MHPSSASNCRLRRTATEYLIDLHICRAWFGTIRYAILHQLLSCEFLPTALWCILFGFIKKTPVTVQCKRLFMYLVFFSVPDLGNPCVLNLTISKGAWFIVGRYFASKHLAAACTLSGQIDAVKRTTNGCQPYPRHATLPSIWLRHYCWYAYTPCRTLMLSFVISWRRLFIPDRHKCGVAFGWFLCERQTSLTSHFRIIINADAGTIWFQFLKYKLVTHSGAANPNHLERRMVNPVVYDLKGLPILILLWNGCQIASDTHLPELD